MQNKYKPSNNNTRNKISKQKCLADQIRKITKQKLNSWVPEKNTK